MTVVRDGECGGGVCHGCGCDQVDEMLGGDQVDELLELGRGGD